MQPQKTLIILAVLAIMLFAATAQADNPYIRLDRLVDRYGDHPWGGELKNRTAGISTSYIAPELIGTPISFLSSIKILFITTFASPLDAASNQTNVIQAHEVNNISISSGTNQKGN